MQSASVWGVEFVFLGKLTFPSAECASGLEAGKRGTLLWRLIPDPPPPYPYPPPPPPPLFTTFYSLHLNHGQEEPQELKDFV
jgi:hypothetical protein